MTEALTAQLCIPNNNSDPSVAVYGACDTFCVNLAPSYLGNLPYDGQHQSGVVSGPSGACTNSFANASF
jgi:hypothetical protein